MDVFVESNFVLELAFRQEEYTFCERIRRGAGPEAYALHLPQYALAEVFEKLRPLRIQREDNQKYLLEQITQHRREAQSDNEAMDELTQALTTLLSERTQSQTQRLYTIAGELAELAAALPLTQAIILEAHGKAREHGLSPQDSLVYASVLAGLRTLPPQVPKLFVSRNEKDFKKQSIITELRALGCEYLISFQAAAGRLRV
jgi:predicted nucleic acid-binding protein